MGSSPTSGTSAVGATSQRHVALDNLLSNDEHDILDAVVLSEANVSLERRAGGVIRHLPLYMLPLLAEEARGERLDGVTLVPIEWA